MVPLLVLLGLPFCHQSKTTPITCIASSPQGDMAVAGAGTHLIVLNRSGKNQLPPFSSKRVPWVESPKRITALAFSPDGTRLAIAAGIPGVEGNWAWVDPKNLGKPQWAPVASQHKDLILCLAWSPDGKRLVTSGHDRLVLIHDGSGKSPPLSIKDHSDAVTAAAFLNTSTVASCGYDRVVKLFNAADGKRLQSFAEGTDWLLTLATSPDGNHLVSGGKDRLLRHYRSKNGALELAGSAFAHSGGIVQIAFSRDGKRLFTLGEDQKLQSWTMPGLMQAGPPRTLDQATHAFALVDNTGEYLCATQTGQVVHHPVDPAGKPSVVFPPPPPAPVISRWHPAYLTAQQNTVLSVEGTHLEELSLQVDGAGLTPRPKSRTPQKIEWDLTWNPGQIAPDKISFTARWKDKTIATQILEVDRFARLHAKENAQANLGPSLTSPQTVQGITLEGSLPQPGATWNTLVPLSAGQPLGVELLPRPGATWAPEIECIRPDGSLFLRGKRVVGMVADQTGPWKLRIHDEQWGGGPKHSFRLELGPIPIVTGVFPKWVSPPMAESGQKLRWLGVHLIETETRIPPNGQPGQLISPPAMRGSVRPAGDAKAQYVSTWESTDPSKVLENESGGQFLLSPIQSSIEWRFLARKGEPLVLSAQGRRHGGTWDPILEILDGSGQPVPRAKLRAVAKTNVTFRDHDAAKPGIRIDTWGDLRTNDFLLAGNDLMRIRQLPRNPDDDCQFYSRKSKRRAFLGTTPIHHPNGQEMFRVEILPPGSTPLPNGMPIVDLPWFNDDGDPEHPKDSWLLFHPPATGEYRARIGDARGVPTGQEFGRFGIRPARPDFNLRAQPVGSWVEGGTALVQVSIDRLDEFSGPVELTWAENPQGKLHSGRLGPDDEEMTLPISPVSGPKGEPFVGTLIATAQVQGKTIQKKSEIRFPKPIQGYGLKVTSPHERLALTAGSIVKCSLEITRPADFKGRVPIDFKGLPFGCQVLDIGLNGILLIPGETRRTVEIACEDWVSPGTYAFVITARQEGKEEVFSKPVILEIKK